MLRQDAKSSRKTKESIMKKMSVVAAALAIGASIPAGAIESNNVVG